MIWALSLFALAALAQDCDVSSLAKLSQRRRECKKRTLCKWRVSDDSCDAKAGCGSLNHGQCRKRNNCYINWTATDQPCLDYDENQSYSCASLAGKKNRAKCKKQPLCIIGGGRGGDSQNDMCLDLPTNLASTPCSDYSSKKFKYVCIAHPTCNWVIRTKQCVDKPDDAACDTETTQEECNINRNGCSWDGSNCVQKACRDITDREVCNETVQDCTWYTGFNARDMDPKKKKADEKAGDKADTYKDQGTCRNGIRRCSDIALEGHCKLADTKHGYSGCYWNPLAKEFGTDIASATRCSETKPCADYGNEVDCLNGDSMKTGSKCVWQLSGDVNKCMEFDCTSADLDSKNKCNSVGCHWHRNKDKRDPTKVGYCGVKDYSQGRRL